MLGFADTLMIGHHSTEELGAASFVNNLFTLCIIFSTGDVYKRQDKFTTGNLLKTKVSLDFDGGRYERMVADTAGYVTVAKADKMCIRDRAVVGIFLSCYFFLQSFFLLGSTVWPKNALIKTFAEMCIRDRNIAE